MQDTVRDAIPDRDQALAVLASFCQDKGDAEDRFNRALLDAHMRPFFVDRRCAPDACAFHLDPSPVCFAREAADGPWHATRCGRAPLPDALNDNCDQDNGRPAHEAYEAFCTVACASMRHPAFALLWRHGSSRRGTLLDGVATDSALIVHDVTFVAIVHRACLALLPDVVGDPTIAALVHRTAKEIDRRLLGARTPGAHAPPGTCHVCDHHYTIPESVSCMRRENAVVLAFCEALARWRSGAVTDDGDDAKSTAVAWADGAVSPQEATERLLAEERARSRLQARAALQPIDSVRYVYFCHRQFFRHDDGLWTCMRRVRDTNGLDEWVPVQSTRAADEGILHEATPRVYDDDGIEALLAAHIIRAPQGLGWATVCRDNGRPHGTLAHMETHLEASPIVVMAADAVLSWSIGPNVLATEMAVRAIETAITSRSHHAKRLAPTLAALSAAQRAIDALYADETVRRLVIGAAIVDQADRAMTAIPIHFQCAAGDRDASGDHIKQSDRRDNSVARPAAPHQNDDNNHTVDDNNTTDAVDRPHVRAIDDKVWRRHPREEWIGSAMTNYHAIAWGLAATLCGAAALVLL
ncbi:hypothetical protein pqer_cds_94 [Pandoravirus quercus]|uniref:Uncharacterized protein n=1 Tax=Pandoravirus quercus TaxID=2107709 RepID=A0A2U7U7W6_9VIRU|nr:hypothetical protein pqer_cds_94 [Pandoravirus quercus]AVK74516.1 hypothetical protein pqer_cds_94 [Pandoravirus quercus]